MLRRPLILCALLFPFALGGCIRLDFDLCEGDSPHPECMDAGSDAGADSGVDAGSDAGVDAGSDSGVDAGPDDAGTDAAPDDAGTDAG